MKNEKKNSRHNNCQFHPNNKLPTKNALINNSQTPLNVVYCKMRS